MLEGNIDYSADMRSSGQCHKQAVCMNVTCVHSEKSEKRTKNSHMKGVEDLQNINSAVRPHLNNKCTYGNQLSHAGFEFDGEFISVPFC